MIVADANLVAHKVIRGPESVLADAVEERDPAWVVPELCKHEFLNILGKAVRSRAFSAQDALRLWNDSLERLRQMERPVHFARALLLACRYSLTPYDCQYAALAEALDIPLVTSDRELCTKLPHIAVSPEQFAGRSRQ